MCYNSVDEYVKTFGKEQADPEGILQAHMMHSQSDAWLAVELACRGLRRGKPFSLKHIKHMFRDMENRAKNAWKDGIVY